LIRPLILATVVLAFSEMGSVQDWMQQAFYPALLLILVTASLGVPIPEDIPLIAAGVLLKTHAGIATWWGTIAVALIGIMCGDLVLYSIGRWWGADVVNHRSVSWMITPQRFARVARQFRRRGAWYCFAGRFIMGVRAVMCMTAGATRFPYWRFFLADLAGALLSVPFFISLGYLFAHMVPTLRAYVSGIQAVVFAAVVIAASIAYTVYKIRREARARRLAARKTRKLAEGAPPLPNGDSAAATDGSSKRDGTPKNTKVRTGT